MSFENIYSFTIKMNKSNLYNKLNIKNKCR